MVTLLGGSDGMSAPLVARSKTRLSHIGRIVATGLTVGMLAGCGGSSSEALSREEVQQSTWQWLKPKLPVRTSLDDPTCVADGPKGHWSCLTTARAAGGVTQTVRIKVTCDDVNCIFETI